MKLVLPSEMFTVTNNSTQVEFDFANPIAFPNPVNLTTGKTTVNGLTGTAVWVMPLQGSAYKKVIINLTGFTSAGTVITFPVAFTITPFATGAAAAIGAAVVTTTTATITSVGAVNGVIVIEGF